MGAMEENDKQLSMEEALQFQNPNPNAAEEEEGDKDEEKDEFDDEEEEYDEEEEEELSVRRVNELEENSTTKPVGIESSKSEETLVLVSKSDLHSHFSASSPLLSEKLTEVPVEYALQPLESTEFKDQVRIKHQKSLVSVPADAFAAQPLNQFPLSSPSAQPTLYGPSRTIPEQKLSSRANGTGVCVPKASQQNSSNHGTGYSAAVTKASFSDGYNWRKYGQKQVKSPQGSRSYYRCACSDCCAKKIEYCDQSNQVIEITYKGQHNHDPLRRLKSTRESRAALSSVESNISFHPVRVVSDSGPSISSREPVQEGILSTETKQPNSSGSDGDVETDVKEEYIDEPDSKQRVKKGGSEYPGSFLKPGKKPKSVVHADGDVGISGDGYRWRKYGQKMVKGNPHPRNYYKCTSAGCPVRKHIERAVDSTTAIIITYKGVHDHDMPVPKRRHGLPSAPLVAAAAPASMSGLQFKKTEVLQDQFAATKWSVDKKGELTGETLARGGEKAMESARALLSIGFEIKPC